LDYFGVGLFLGGGIVESCGGYILNLEGRQFVIILTNIKWGIERQITKLMTLNIIRNQIEEISNFCMSFFDWISFAFS
jgi:hypothetical protein